MPEIHVDIYTRLHEREMERDADKITRNFERQGNVAGRRWSKGASEGIRAGESDIRSSIERITVSFDKESNAVKRATKAHDDFGRSANQLGRQASGAADDIKVLVGSMLNVRAPGAAGAAAIGVLGVALVDIAKFAVTASQSLALLPAAAATAGAGFGTLTLATANFADTIKNVRDPEKFAAGIQALAPAAQQTALEIRNLLPEFDKLQQATQDTFFKGFAEQLHNLTNQFLPSIQNLTTSIAASFNQAIMGISTDFMKPENAAQIQQIFSNIAGTFQELVPGARAFSQALLDITAAGSDFMPGLARNISDAAQQFANFIREARNSGKLHEFIQNGIDAVKMLAEELGKIARTLYKVFGEDGPQNIETFRSNLEGIRILIATMGGDFDPLRERWANNFRGMGQDVQNFFAKPITDIIKNITDQFNTLINALNLNPLARFLGIGKIPNIPSMGIGAGGGAGPSTVTNLPGGGVSATIGYPPAPAGPPPGSGAYVPGGPLGLRPYAPSAVPAPPPTDAQGNKPSRTDILNQIKSGLRPEEYQVANPFGPTGTPGALGPYGPMGGGGAVDPQKVIEEQNDVRRAAHNLEESRKDLLALERSNLGSAEEINDLKWKVAEDERALQEQQYDLQTALRGETKDLASAFGELGAALDPDLGISKGLAGLADNLVRFIGAVATAPLTGPLAAMAGQNKTGAGGLIGMAALGLGGAGTQGAGAGAGTQGAGAGALPSFGQMALGSLNTPEQIAAGGNRAAAVFALAQSLTGTPYSMALRNDCSGMVSRLAAAAVGLPDPSASQRFATPGEASWLASHGFLQGRGGPGDLRIGIDPRPGSAGHTAATLPSGIGAETGQGPNGSFGLGGPGANQSRFTQFYYLPMGAQAAPPPTAGAPPRTAAPPLDAGPGIGGAGINNTDWAHDPANPNRLPGYLTGGPVGIGSGLNNPEFYQPQSWLEKTWADMSAKEKYHLGIRDAMEVNANQIGGRDYKAQTLGPGAVPIIAHQGEFIVRNGPAQRFGPLLDRINHFQDGGVIGAGLGRPTPPTQYGGTEPYSNPAGGGPGMTSGGTLDMALGMASSALDVVAPGASIAAQIGIKEINRAVQYAGQVAGIGVQGLLDTFLPFGGSELASNNWLTRIVGGIASAAPQLPNMAGGKGGGTPPPQPGAPPPGAPTEGMVPPPLTPEQTTLGGGAKTGDNPPIAVTYNHVGAKEDPAIKDLTWNLGHMNSGHMGAMPGMGRGGF